MTSPNIAHSAHSSTNNCAISSMILGILSLALFILPLGIPAIILGIVSLKKGESDRGLSIAGIVTGSIATLILLSLIAFIVLIIAIGETGVFESDGVRPGAPYSQSQT